jgi:hypothetical protein
MVIDDIEALQIEPDRQPVRINAFDANMKVIKFWEFPTYSEAWKAFEEIHDEWWTKKKEKLNGVKKVPE